PKGLLSFMTAMPVWIKEKVFQKKIIHDELKAIQPYDKGKLKLLFPEHHLSHAASAFFPSPFEEAAIVTLDGVGEWATASICKGEGNSIRVLKELHFPHSIGLLYSAFTYFLGFRVNSGEYKLMGLAPYGIGDSAQVREYIQSIQKELIEIMEDGSIWINQEYFRYATGLSMVNEKKWSSLFGFARSDPESPIHQEHANLALAIQRVTEEVLLKIALEAKRITGSEHLCLAGGVALNCVANGKLMKEGIFRELFIQPAAGDAGGSIGAALSAYHIYYQMERSPGPEDAMHGALLGPDFSDREIELVAKKFGAVVDHFREEEDLTEKVASLLAEGKVVGWFQGRMEFGPRALGNRSILGDARNRDMQKKLNLKIKYRESFRPFAPAVLAEDAKDYFDLPCNSPYMLLTAPVRETHRKEIPENYDQLPLMDRLYVDRSVIPAVTHIDFSARIQTVHRESNPRFHRLLGAMKQKTGTSVVVNTSFNVRGEPIVCSPLDAYRCFMRTEMDYLVMGNYLFEKSRQPGWPEEDRGKREVALD
ncbi:MAG: carbamoyltransferase C-terminal domain-containing protein, partial [Deltaproteobacteria bacterium]